MIHKMTRFLFFVSFLLAVFGAAPAPACANESMPVISWGSGRVEVMVFSDYFCPPCQTLDPQIEPVLEDILARGGAKVYIVDVPIHRSTILYNRFYLYAARANDDIRNVSRVRRTLYHFARTSPDARKATEEILSELFRKERIAFTPFDVKPVQMELGKIIKRYKIDSTPTCIIKYSESDIKEYGGVQEILDGLKILKAHLQSNAR